MFTDVHHITLAMKVAPQMLLSNVDGKWVKDVCNKSAIQVFAMLWVEIL